MICNISYPVLTRGIIRAFLVFFFHTSASQLCHQAFHVQLRYGGWVPKTVIKPVASVWRSFWISFSTKPLPIPFQSSCLDSGLNRTSRSNPCGALVACAGHNSDVSSPTYGMSEMIGRGVKKPPSMWRGQVQGRRKYSLLQEMYFRFRW